jgi:hypothetical protein
VSFCAARPGLSDQISLVLLPPLIASYSSAVPSCWGAATSVTSTAPHGEIAAFLSCRWKSVNTASSGRASVSFSRNSQTVLASGFGAPTSKPRKRDPLSQSLIGYYLGIGNIVLGGQHQILEHR